MNKPRKRPITIQLAVGLKRLVEIETLTDDAEEWTQKHAAEYGELMKDPLKPKQWLLFVYHGYEANEVINYLRDLWDSKEWPQDIDAA